MGRVVIAGRVAEERTPPGGRVIDTGRIAKERLKTNRRVAGASCEVQERIVALRGVAFGVASVRWRANRLSRLRKRKPCKGESQRNKEKTATQRRSVGRTSDR